MSQKHRMRWPLIFIVMALLILASLQLASQRALADFTNYYVDSVHGNDTSCDGKSPSCPLATFQKFNNGSITLQPGDYMHLDNGSRWLGTGTDEALLHPYGSGVGLPTRGPILLSGFCNSAFYDCVNHPPAEALLNGNGDTAALELKNQQWWEISFLEIQNVTANCPYTLPLPPIPQSCQADHKGVWIHGYDDPLNDGGAINHIYLSHLMVDNVIGEETNKINNTEEARQTGGIVFTIDKVANPGTPTYWNDVQVTNNLVYNVVDNGIHFHSVWSGYITANGQQQPCTLYSARPYEPSTGVVVQGNTVYNTASSGIAVQVSAQPVLANNIVSYGDEDKWGEMASGRWIVMALSFAIMSSTTI